MMEKKNTASHVYCEIEMTENYNNLRDWKVWEDYHAQQAALDCSVYYKQAIYYNSLDGREYVFTESSTDNPADVYNGGNLAYLDRDVEYLGLFLN